MKGALLIVSGPSGAGKSSLIHKILETTPDAIFSISSTTRTIRDGEIDGVNYFFTTKEKFEKDIEDGLFLEWAKVHENYYGTSLKPILKFIKEGKLVILDIDVQGFKIAREKFSEYITSVFVTTNSQAELKSRLENRKTNSDEDINRRLNNALLEMTHIHEYDFLVINDDLHLAAKELSSIALAARKNTKLVNLGEFIGNWTNLE
ncbi:MAG: guanylate kinase [Campylobacteraceae bacterium]